MKSWNFPRFPDDHGIIMDSRNFHGNRNYGKFRKFGNVYIVDKTRINLCIVKINHGNVTELAGALKYLSHKIKEYFKIFQTIESN